MCPIGVSPPRHTTPMPDTRDLVCSVESAGRKLAQARREMRSASPTNVAVKRSRENTKSKPATSSNAQPAKNAKAPSRESSQYWLSGYPSLVAEWHSTLNGELRSEEVSYGSGLRVWWRCRRGPDHEWRASVNNRTAAKTGCPYCAGRRLSVTNSLAALFADVAEDWHPTRNGNVRPEDVLAGSSRPVWWKCRHACDHEWRASPHARIQRMSGCPFCARLRVSHATSLASVAPKLATEWHRTRNGSITPNDVAANSSHKVWWGCAEGHEWQATIYNRRRGSGCPYCTGRRLDKNLSLAVTAPEIAREWHPTRNGLLTPRDVSERSKQSVWWICARGHERRSPVSARAGKRRLGCPICRRQDRWSTDS